MAHAVSKIDPLTRNMFAAAYRFMEQNHNTNNTEQAWLAVSTEMTLIALRFDNHPLMLALLSACYAEIERRVQSVE